MHNQLPAFVFDFFFKFLVLSWLVKVTRVYRIQCSRTGWDILRLPRCLPNLKAPIFGLVWLEIDLLKSGKSWVFISNIIHTLVIIEWKMSWNLQNQSFLVHENKDLRISCMRNVQSRVVRVYHTHRIHPVLFFLNILAFENECVHCKYVWLSDRIKVQYNSSSASEENRDFPFIILFFVLLVFSFTEVIAFRLGRFETVHSVGCDKLCNNTLWKFSASR